MGLGQSGRVAVTLFDAGGHVTCARITYSSGTPTVASVDTTGQIVGLALGFSTLVVSAGGKVVSNLGEVRAVAPGIAGVVMTSEGKSVTTTITVPAP